MLDAKEAELKLKQAKIDHLENQVSKLTKYVQYVCVPVSLQYNIVGNFAIYQTGQRSPN